MYVSGYGHVQTHKQPTRAVKAAMRAVAQERGWSYDASMMASSGVRIANRTLDGWLVVTAYVSRNRGEPSDVSVAGGVRLDRVAHVGLWPGDKDVPPLVEQALNVYEFRLGYLTEDEQLFDYSSPSVLTPLVDEIRTKDDYAESMADPVAVVEGMLANRVTMRASGTMHLAALEILVAGNAAWEQELDKIRQDQADAMANFEAYPDVQY